MRWACCRSTSRSRTSTIGFGSTAGNLAGTVQLSAADVQSVLDGRYYLNIHSEDFGGGVIRGNLVPVVAAIPEPGSLAALGLIGVAAGVRRRRRE